MKDKYKACKRRKREESVGKGRTQKGVERKE
jgi:hypothetical protein